MGEVEVRPEVLQLRWKQLRRALESSARTVLPSGTPSGDPSGPLHKPLPNPLLPPPPPPIWGSLSFFYSLQWHEELSL